MELILGDFLASGASHNALNGLKFGESAPFRLFDTHKKFQFTQITLSLPNDHFITFNDNHHFDDDAVIWVN